jgi:hypothetical protein
MAMNVKTGPYADDVLFGKFLRLIVLRNKYPVWSIDIIIIIIIFTILVKINGNEK